MPARKVQMTIDLSADLLEAMDTIVREGAAESRNDFLDRAVRRQLAATSRARVDAEFAQMANDPAYQEEALQVAEDLGGADWEALQAGERSA
jgi:metal-responsive CopG/Arc/MetJ family transcriptional regulator